jgi:hypothetical protein
MGGNASMKSLLDRMADWQGTASVEEVFDFCDTLCRVYLEGDVELRSELRKAVAANQRLRDSLLYNSLYQVGPGAYLTEAARRAHVSGDYTRYLRSALLTISLTDGFDDSRDTLMWLADLWREVEEKGVHPDPHFREIGDISSTEAIHIVGGPTAAMILQMLDKRRRDELRWP